MSLTPAEADRLIASAGVSGRHGQRDQTLLLLMYRQGLRVSEAVSLRWEQVDLKAGLLHVRRPKNGVPSTHPSVVPSCGRSGSCAGIGRTARACSRASAAAR